ncbi:MAG: hypothetical protein H0X40_04225 [Chthoniobacterales bacterium]|nr:hypothetical protein [Chthoniobacterales bacterium]
MRRIAQLLPLLCALVILQPTIERAQSPAPDYGAYPQNYREIVTAWLNSSLGDPKSVQVKWLGEPKPGQLAVTKDQQVSGYLVEFTVNARNVFGSYTGPQKHTALVRDGKVITATGFLYH